MDDLHPLIDQPSADEVRGQAPVHPSAGPVGRARASLRALEALDRITGQGTEATPDDMVALQGWAGWGPMAPAFSSARSGSWQEIGERLECLLPPSQLREAEQATPNAFYTPPGLAAGCWQILHGLGFRGGRILEPGCGAGAFLTATPADIETTWVGVERDPVTARIARLLHPAAQIINEPLQNAALPAHSMDAVIGNVPFSEAPVYDPTAPKDVARSLHNYCIWRSVRCLRPGGLAVLITSRYTMDARDDGARRAIAGEADLVGAIRLPGDALTSGGTEVVADILVLRRRSCEAPGSAPGWTEAVRLCDAFPGQEWEYADHVNQWFVAHPLMVLGEMRPDHAARHGRTLRVDRPDHSISLPAALAQATTALVGSASDAGLTWEPAATPFPDVSAAGIPQRADGRKERSFHLADGAVWQVQDGELAPVAARARELADLTALIRLRDAAVAVLNAEADHDRGGDSIGPLRAALNSAYDHYVAGHGPLNRATIVSGDPDPETGLATLSRRRPRMGGFRQDPDYVTVLALENYDEETGTASKTPIFSRRVNKRPQRPARAGTPDEAIRICLDTRGRLDLPAIAGLLDIPAADSEALESRGRSIVTALQERARAGGREPLGRDELCTVLEIVTSLSADVIDRVIRPGLADRRAQSELDGAVAPGRARAADIDEVAGLKATLAPGEGTETQFAAREPSLVERFRQASSRLARFYAICASSGAVNAYRDDIGGQR